MCNEVSFMRKEFKYITAISMIFSLLVIVWSGVQLPWNEEAALYAIYGSTVGFCSAVVMGMFVVWKINRKHK